MRSTRRMLSTSRSRKRTAIPAASEPLSPEIQATSPRPCMSESPSWSPRLNSISLPCGSGCSVSMNIPSSETFAENSLRKVLKSLNCKETAMHPRLASIVELRCDELRNRETPRVSRSGLLGAESGDRAGNPLHVTDHSRAPRFPVEPVLDTQQSSTESVEHDADRNSDTQDREVCDRRPMAAPEASPRVDQEPTHEGRRKHDHENQRDVASDRIHGQEDSMSASDPTAPDAAFG